MEEKTVIETERLILREPRITDLADFRAGVNNREITDILFNVPYPFTGANARSMIEKAISQMNTINDRHFFFELKSENKVIGSLRIGVRDGVGDLCGHVNPAYQNQGYMQEAMNAIFEMLFESKVIKEFTIFIFEGNASLLHIAEKLGFIVKPTEEFVAAKSTEKRHRLIKAYLTKLKWKKEKAQASRTS